MRKITLKKLTFYNFKGLRKFESEFGQVANVKGANGTGKTTLKDGFSWAFFGKNSEDKSDFSIKTQDENGNSIPKLEHIVIALLDVDGEEVEVKRTLKETWSKKRGCDISEYVGNSTKYSWNGSPKTQAEFKNKLDSLINEEVFKIITNPLHFSKLHWTKRREILEDLCGGLSDQEIASSSAEFSELLQRLKGGSFEEFKNKLKSDKKLLNDNLKHIPARVDEVDRGMPDSLDFDSLRSTKEGKEVRLEEIEASLLDSSRAVEAVNLKKSKNQTDIHNLKSEMQNIAFSVKEEAFKGLNELKSSLSSKKVILDGKKRSLSSLTSESVYIKKEIESIDKSITSKRESWKLQNSERLHVDEDSSGFSCPACKRDFEEGKKAVVLESLNNNFNSDKKSKLEKISHEGEMLSDSKTKKEEYLKKVDPQISTIESEISTIESEIKELESKISTTSEPDVQSLLVVHQDYHQKKSKVELLELNQFNTTVDNSELIEQKNSIASEIKSLDGQLALENQISSAKERIKNLEKEEKELSQKIANLEKEEFLIEKFEKTKIDSIESRVNSMFGLVKFRMFETQVNGGLNQCCDILIDGVPFDDANNAGKVNAGVDIINKLSQHYGITAPIFIDNREGVTDLIHTDSQVINLYVNPDEVKLKIS